MNRVVVLLIWTVAAVVAPEAQDICCTASPQILPKRLMKLAGQSALDCGHVLFHDSADAANQCAEAALRNETPFYVSYEQQGIDSWLATGLVLDGKGKMFELHFDSMRYAPMTTREKRMGVKRMDDDHIVVMPCPTPLQLRTAANGKSLTCFPSVARPEQSQSVVKCSQVSLSSWELPVGGGVRAKRCEACGGDAQTRTMLP